MEDNFVLIALIFMFDHTSSSGCKSTSSRHKIGRSHLTMVDCGRDNNYFNGSPNCHNNLYGLEMETQSFGGYDNKSSKATVRY